MSRGKSTATRNARVAGLVAAGLRGAMSLLGAPRKLTMLSTLAEAIVPVVEVTAAGNRTMKFWCPGGWSLYRARSVLEKEPLTIRWIDSLESDSIIWDIGANIGAYTVYAAVTKNLRVYAFEPSAANAAILNKNIELNAIDHLVTALPIALSEKTRLDYLHMISTSSGNTGGQFATAESRSSNVFRQACLGFTIDDLIDQYKLPPPNYIKMDVDGIEISILKGAPRTLANTALKSVILEADITTQEYKDIENLLASYGFTAGESEPTVKGRDHMRNLVFSH